MATKELNTRQKMAEREKGRAWARKLQMADVFEFLNQQVLGDFDWRDWFERKPTGIFLNAAFDECQFREELSE